MTARAAFVVPSGFDATTVDPDTVELAGSSVATGVMQLGQWFLAEKGSMYGSSSL